MRHAATRRASTPQVVSPAWLLKSLGVTLLAALLCAWLTACLLFYQGSWQLVLHPSHTLERTPSSMGLAYSSIRFGASETGQPRLTGWWLPAQSADRTQASFQPRYANLTVLYLHGGSGSLSDAVPILALLHSVGLNVFAIDYRGFGASDSSAHPSAETMAQDAADALDYLIATRHIPAPSIIPYGSGLAASLAINLTRANTALPALIIDNPDPDPARTAASARPSSIIPVRLIFGRQFDIAGPLGALPVPKLLIAGGPGFHGDATTMAAIQSLFRRAASPRFSVTLAPRDDDRYRTTLRRFLDQNLQ